MIIVSPELKAQLSRLPEYGMGYQVGSVRLNSNGTEEGIILNGEVFLKFSDAQSIPNLFAQYEQLLFNARFNALKVIGASLIERPASEIRGIRKIRLHSFSMSTVNEKRAGAKDAEDSYTTHGEVFKRFSAYANDFRVTTMRGLTAGTYATTAEDALNVGTGIEAVLRYALENKAPANKVFTIKPPGNTKLKRGIVEPAYGEPGGGVEVIFVDGSPSGTVTGPVIIPER
ncbi:hypothetical protein [Geminisphaera colitermitum]|uniref:hypothetical protein n=1 Tax=Geminisphaera colitermitum TaxID=1148786 RepID=UPI00019653CC|nr:hypothetical protein [Geminisphaera colitermitum]